MEDDYLSDAFLVDADAKSGLTYTQRRRQALLQGRQRDLESKSKSRKQLEADSREEGLSKSLFQRAQEDAVSGSGHGNKAMSMMMKMGFKPGQSLGSVSTSGLDKGDASSGSSTPNNATGHRTEPLPLQLWSGKDGLGKRKRPISPDSAAKQSKAKAEDSKLVDEDFRTRARVSYEEKRDTGRLANALQVCKTLDEKIGMDFNHLWLDPLDSATFPGGLTECLEDASFPSPTKHSEEISEHNSISRLKRQMKADRLDLIPEWDDDQDVNPVSGDDSILHYSPETLLRVKTHCAMTVSERLGELLLYLRQKHNYCFWCGMQYNSQDEILSDCPGQDEADHD